MTGGAQASRRVSGSITGRGFAPVESFEQDEVFVRRCFAAGVGGRDAVERVPELLECGLTWRPKGWDHESTIQVGLRPAGPGKTTVVHQERLAGPEERAALIRTARVAPARSARR
ncbi:hypothetical protein [Amycolatopsis sp. cmx-11-51]|uniref:hypothetical protein n=1 Tax=unclassified Amycolatopsis TaxID=2618356 RepID=UPI0039E48562